MAIPEFPTPPAPPQRGVDDESTFRVKADVWTNYLGFDFGPDLDTFGAALIAEATSFFTATSVSAVTLGTGSKALTIQAGKAFKPDQYIQIVATGDLTKYLFGTVTSYNITTGALVVNVLTFGGTGSVSSWNVSITGPQGVAGFTVLNGAIAPTGGVGRDGDFYYNTATFGFYGPKAGGAWPAPVILKGNTTLNGVIAPVAGIGRDGDFYIDTNMWDIYGPKAGGAWPVPVSLIGPIGAATWAQISSQSLTGASVVFTSIPQSFGAILIDISNLNVSTTADIIIGLSTDGVTFTSSILNAALGTGSIRSGSIMFEKYTADRGPLAGGLSAAGNTGLQPSSSPTDFMFWACSGGIKAIRLSVSTGAFSAGTVSLHRK